MINGPVWDERQLDGTSPTILAIGDSWFWYPFNNLANPLHRILNRSREHIILVRGRNGATTSEYVKGRIREQIEWDLDKAHGYGRTIQAVFLSGGGNDLLDTFADKLNEVAKNSKNIHMVSCLGTLKSKEWANELHPVRSGFNKLAKKWTPVLQTSGLIP